MKLSTFVGLSNGRLSRFGMLWQATAAANLADGVFKLTLPLLAAQVTDSPALVAGAAFMVRLPWLIFALLAGVLADRFDRRQMMLTAHLARFIGLLLVALMCLSGAIAIPMIYAIAFALGIAETLADTASASILPSLVESNELEQANARLVGVITITNEFIGPPLGGILAGISLAVAFATSSALYLVAAVAIFYMSGIYKPHIAQLPKNIFTEMADGLRFVWRDRVLRALVIIVAVMNLGWSAWGAIMVVYVVTPGAGGLSEFGYGVMLTSIGIGGLVGTVLAVPLVRRFGRWWAIAADIIGTVIMLAVPAVTANPWAIGAAAVIGGIGGAMWSIVVSSMRQQRTPDEMQGKTSGVFRLFGYGALPIGAALAGVIAEFTSIPMVFALCAGLTVFLFIPFYRDIAHQ